MIRSLVVEPKEWPVVACGGKLYAVAPRYIAPVSLQDALTYAQHLGLQLPTKALVDAIWEAADCKLDASRFVRSDHDGTPRTMASGEMIRSQQERVDVAIAKWAEQHGYTPQLVAGTHKDVVLEAGRLGIYGWHLLKGGVIQGPGVSYRHAPGWIDYSQGARLVLPL